MGLFGPSKAELTAAAETCAADTDRDRCAARTARDARLRAVDYRERATDRCQALGKGERTRAGAAACAAHVAGYTVTTSLLLGLVVVLVGLPVSPLGFAAGQLISAGTHYWADRRDTLAWLARVLGKGGYYDHGGAFELDQAYHRFWLLITALVTALV